MSFVMLTPTRLDGDRVGPALASRPQSLEGMVIGTLWNNRANGDHYLELLGKELVARHGVRQIVPLKKIYNNSSAPEGIVKELKEKCDAVVVGVGD